MSQQLSEQEVVRRENLQKMLDLGINPYPSTTFPVSHVATEVHAGYTEGSEDYQEVCMAGRLMSRRIMGKASFAELQDTSGRMQIYVSRDDICPGEDKAMYNTVFKKLLDLGDFIGIKGKAFTTKTGTKSIHISELTILSKSLKPLPIVKTDADGNVYDEMTDPEFKYRQRYVDLTVNPEVREVFRQRSRMINAMRDYMTEKGYLEVETPILQTIYGGAAARPFKTHHNTLDIDMYMRIANELYLKRLIVGGFDGVFEFAKDFRNEGMSRFHNPEFTMMELYVAYKDYNWMMDFTEEMLEAVALKVHGTTELEVGENTISFKRPWKRYTMFGAIKHFTGVDITDMDEAQLRDTAKSLDIHTDKTMGKAKIIDEIFGEKCEPLLIQPTFITDYPKEMSPLAKSHADTPHIVERFEAICNAKEILNAFSELNDPIDQRERFEAQLELGKRGDEEAMQLDEDYLRAMEYGMPPTAGIGIGIDRLAMIMTNQKSIQDVLLFPQMKPERTVISEADDETA